MNGEVRVLACDASISSSREEVGKEDSVISACRESRGVEGGGWRVEGKDYCMLH